MTLITHVNTVTVYVDDQDSSLEFWTDKVGFVVRKSEPMGPDARWIEVGPEDAQTCLVLYPKSMMENWEELRTSIVFDCDDIGETYASLKSRSVEFDGEPQPMHWGTFVKFSDIDGNVFLLRG